MSNVQFHSDLDRLIEILPPKITKYVDADKLFDVIELVLDLGRQAEIRHSDGSIEYIGDENVVEEDIKYITDRVQEFTSDNRSGIPGTLHRISAIRNRQGKIVGLTCRIGRVVTGTIACIKDFVVQNKSILFLGRPGVGKTTTAINLSASLASLGQKVLALDMDPQGNMTSGLGVNKDEAENTVYDLIIGNVGIEECIYENVIENLDVLPSNINLSAAEIELIGIDNKEYLLKEEVDKIRDRYDFIIIDCPPALSMLTINAMTTADSVIVPIQCEYYALEGLSQLIHTIELVQERLNSALEIEGVVFTMYDARTNLSLQVVENVKDNLNQAIYKTIIPRNIRLAEAPSYGMPITLYDPRSTGAESYMLLAEEVIHKGEE